MNNIYINGKYLEKHPDWHEKDAQLKADQILFFLKKNNMLPTTLSEIGCGSGEILKILSKKMIYCQSFTGYEISPQAFEICKKKQCKLVEFVFGDSFSDDKRFDIVLCIDVIEHIQDYYSFLKNVKRKGSYFLFRIPLDLTMISTIKSGYFSRLKNTLGHIHFFNLDIAIDALKSVGYEIIDFQYVACAKKAKDMGVKQRISHLFFKVLYFFNRNISVRFFGGCSLMVLAK